MKGSAPNFSCTGSQADERRNFTPPRWPQAGAATRPSSSRMSPATTRSEPPKTVIPHPQARSPRFPGRAGVEESAPGAPVSAGSGNGDRLALDLEVLGGLLEHLPDRRGKRCVLERGGGGLPLLDGPPEELHERLPLCLVLRVLVDEQVGE